eukprot:scaffold12850_cov109-Isochrysis_galbana.AAC.2
MALKQRYTAPTQFKPEEATLDGAGEHCTCMARRWSCSMSMACSFVCSPSYPCAQKWSSHSTGSSTLTRHPLAGFRQGSSPSHDSTPLRSRALQCAATAHACALAPRARHAASPALADAAARASIPPAALTLSNSALASAAAPVAASASSRADATPPPVAPGAGGAGETPNNRATRASASADHVGVPSNKPSSSIQASSAPWPICASSGRECIHSCSVYSPVHEE